MASKAEWRASYLAFGGLRVSAAAPVSLRFPGQWFQAEGGLHQNWMRDYDPALGRYLQADPLGLIDGASVYGYALQNPGRWTDPRGESVDPTHTSAPTEQSRRNADEELVCFIERKSCSEHFSECVATDLYDKYGGRVWGMSTCGSCLEMCVADGGNDAGNWPDTDASGKRCDYWSYSPRYGR